MEKCTEHKRDRDKFTVTQAWVWCGLEWDRFRKHKRERDIRHDRERYIHGHAHDHGYVHASVPACKIFSRHVTLL